MIGNPQYDKGALRCRELAKELRVNLLGYDYAGYGASQGEPSVLNALADIEACYQWLLSVKGKQPRDIVLYGQSSPAPTCNSGDRKAIDWP